MTLTRTPDARQPAGARSRAVMLASSPWKLVLLAVAGLVVLSAVREVTGANDLTAGGTVGAALTLSVPIALAALGGLWSERAGVINIGLEGMMILGTWFGAWATFAFHSPWIGLAVGVAGGMAGGLLHALATVTFGVDHIVSGVAINILAAGLTRYLSVQFFIGLPGGGASQSPQLPGFPTIDLLPFGDALAAVEELRLFLLSDLVGIVRGLTTNLSLLTIVAVLLVPLSYFVLWHTAFGLRLRSCGENPAAAESLGVGVYRMKYAGVLISGALSGLAGVFLVTVASSAYQEGQTGGRGFIGLAAMIFGNWRPGGLAAGAGLFGFTDALQLRGSASAVHALLLLLAIALLPLAVRALWRRRFLVALVTGVVVTALAVWFFTTDTVPRQLVTYSPHITTLLVLSLASQRLRMPAADGVRYRKGEGG